MGGSFGVVEDEMILLLLLFLLLLLLLISLISFLVRDEVKEVVNDLDFLLCAAVVPDADELIPPLLLVVALLLERVSGMIKGDFCFHI